MSRTTCSLSVSAVRTTPVRRPARRTRIQVDELEDLGHVVADEDDAHPTLINCLDQLEHPLRFANPERRGRLVQDHDAPPKHHGPADCHRLALAPREGLNALAHRTETDVQRV